MKLYKQFADDSPVENDYKNAVRKINDWVKSNKSKLESYSIASDVPDKCGGSIIILAYKMK